MTERISFQTTDAERKEAILRSAKDFSIELPEDRRILPLEKADEYAQALRLRFRKHAAPLAITESFAEQNDIRVRYTHMGRNTYNALTVASKGRDIRFIMNFDSVEKWGSYYNNAHEVFALFMAHEIGHWLFFRYMPSLDASYEQIDIERGVVSGPKRRAHEQWCDRFGEQLTGLRRVT
jgi:hypothetical protein